MSKAIDENGLSHILARIKANFALESHTHTAASASAAGMMSATHYSKLDALPTASEISSTYALKSEITSMYRHKGSVAAVANLPDTGQTAGDVYNVTATGMNYVWTGTEWDALGAVFSVEYLSNNEIDIVFTNAGLSVSSS